MKKRSLVVGIYSLIVFIVVAFSAVYLFSYYQKGCNDLYNQMFPSKNESENFSLFDGIVMAEKNIEPRVSIILKSGESFREKFFIRNYDQTSGHNFAIKYVNVYKLGEKKQDGKREQILLKGGDKEVPLIVFDKNGFEVGPDGVLLFYLDISIPSSTQEGDYLISVSLAKNDSSAEFLVKNNVRFDMAVGKEIKLIVNNTLPKYEYRDFESIVKDTALKQVIERGRFLIAIILVLFIIVFVVKGLKSKK